MRLYSILTVVCSTIAVTISGGPLLGQGFPYPKVMTPGGRYYGPTMAGSEYQRRYGQQWHGLGGFVSPVAPQNFNIRLYPTFVPYGWYGNFGYGCTTTGYGYVPPGYVGNYYTQPEVYVPPIIAMPCGSPRCMPHRAYYFSDGLFPDSRYDRRGGPNLGEGTPPVAASYQPQISLDEAQAASDRRLHDGDLWLKKLDYENARRAYEVSMDLTPEAALPHFRLGMVLTGLGRFPDAVAQFKRGLEIDPAWPANGESLDELFGANNAAEKSKIKNRTADWVQQDIRDPDRLFLMGTLLHFDRHNQAGVFFEAAMKLAGTGAHLDPFLRPPSPDASNGLAAATPPAATDASFGEKENAPPGDVEQASASFVPPLPAPEIEASETPSTDPSAPPSSETGHGSGPVLRPPNS